MSEQQQRDGFGRDKNERRFNGAGSGRPNFGGRDFSRGGGRDSGQTQLFRATCSNCGKPCEVPFRPSGDKPVYCKECFMRKREESARVEGRREIGARDFQRRGVSPAFSSAPQGGGGVRLDDLKRQMDALNAKLDTVLQRIGGSGLQPAKAAAKEKGTVGAKHVATKSRKSSKAPKK